jgi:ABC-type transport system substrate-binding protein
MKRNNKTLLIILFLSISVIPNFAIFSTNAKGAVNSAGLIVADDNCTFIAAGGSAGFNYWAPSTYTFSVGDWMILAAFEGLFVYKDDALNTLTDAIPILATGYTNVEYYPEEINGDGWKNTGGIKSIDIVLRENVKFHDGSEFNATVAKWNIDRYMILLGNLTGTQYYCQWKHQMYRPAVDYKDFFTPSWNYSYMYNHDPIWGAPVTPQYYGKNNDPNLSWTTVSKTYQVDGWYPMFNKTLIVESADDTTSGTGGTIRIEINDWQTGVNYISLIPMMSMMEYAGWFNYQIWDSYDYNATTSTKLLVGTGPYKAINVDKVDKNQMIMERFDDHWNFTAQRAAGKAIVKDAIVQLYTGAQTEADKTTALISGDVDFSADGAYSPLNPTQVIASPSTDYFPDGVADSIEQLIFIWPHTTLALRKAICHAFNYTKYIDIGLEGRAVRAYNPLGVNSAWYNPSIIGATTDLTIARETLLNDSIYGPLLAAQGITATSPTAAWTSLANSIENAALNISYINNFTLNYFEDVYNEDFLYSLESGLELIGMVFNKTNPTIDNPYGDWRITGTDNVFMKIIDYVIYGSGAPYNTGANGMQAYYIDWPVPRLEIGYWDAYYTTVSWYNTYFGTGFWDVWRESWNTGWLVDAENTKLIHSLYLKNDTEKQKTYDQIVKWHSQEQYPNMYTIQNKVGYGVSRKFNVDWYWGVMSFIRVGVGPGLPAGLTGEIPGFEIPILLSISMLTFLSICYVIMRKKKFELK